MNNSNKEAFEYTKSITPIIKNLCKPLSSVGIEHFGYLKIFKDSTYIYLSNNEDITKEYLQTVESSNIFFDKFIQNTVNNTNKYHILWPDAALNHSMEIYLKNRYWNGSSMIQFNKDNVEIWWFAADLTNTEIKDFYIRNTGLLEAFTNYFTYQIQNQLRITPKTLAKYCKGFDFSLTSLEKIENEKQITNQLITKLLPKGLMIHTRNGIVKITKREIECLRLLDRGYTADQISSYLNISNKTVCQHKENIKHKTGYYLRSDLINLYRDQIATIFF